MRYFARMAQIDTFKTRTKLNVGGIPYDIFSLKTLAKQFGYERMRYFQPLRSLFDAGAVAGGGSDHMQKLGSLRSVNPYNPFLAMATAVTRRIPTPCIPPNLQPLEKLQVAHIINLA